MKETVKDGELSRLKKDLTSGKIYDSVYSLHDDITFTAGSAKKITIFHFSID